MHLLVLAFIATLLLPPKISPDLIEDYLKARMAWTTQVCPKVTEVRWCRQQECEDSDRYIAHWDKGLILLRPAYEWDDYPNSIRATLTHEIGHALGVPDLLNTSGVMSYDWDYPLALLPTAQEFSYITPRFLCH